jgi:type IV pilus biogenesis protein CpaD/CtpE
MKKLLLILAVALLPGCAAVDAYLMKYDTNEYRVISEIRADANEYKAACTNELLSNTNAVAMATKTQFFVFYAEYIPHNDPVKAASIELNKIAQGLKDQYTKGKVSPMFCKIKYETIEKSAEAMQKTIGDKPR